MTKVMACTSCSFCIPDPRFGQQYEGEWKDAITSVMGHYGKTKHMVVNAEVIE